MRYSCDDIQRILNSEEDPEVEYASFDRHMESCPRCADSCDLGPELEGVFRVSLPRAVPAGFDKQLSDRLNIHDKDTSEIDCPESLISFVFTLMSLALSAIIFNYWNEFKSIFVNVNFSSISVWIVGFYDKIQLPSTDFSAIGAIIPHTSIIVLGILSLMAIVWLFSVFENNKATR